MASLFQRLIRATSFLQKEFYEVLRQPRLIFSLVLGPFLILFLFGIGYRDQQQTLRAIFVVPPDAAIPAETIKKYGNVMGDLFTTVGVTSDVNSALSQLKQRKVDIVIAEPPDVVNTIKSNHQAAFTIYHNEIDPVQISYIDYLGWLYVGAVNQQVLQDFVGQGQKNSTELQKNLQSAHQNISATKQAIQSGDIQAAKQNQLQLTENLAAISFMAGSSLPLLDNIQPAGGANASNDEPAQTTIADLDQNTNKLNDNSASPQDRIASLDKLDRDIAVLQNRLTFFQGIQSYIIVSPFKNETRSVANFQPSLLFFFVPAVLSLLLQHAAVTFASLSIVRERNVGTMELFKVSPLSATEALFGKYLSYMIFDGLIAAVLAFLLSFVLHVPMLGNWWYFAMVIAAILFTSLGYGFVISMISQTDSQAVQYSMILLLASVFFSGFIMGLEKFWAPVKILSWLLPTTYGTIILRDIALRGSPPDWILLAGLIGLGLVLLLISWILMRRLIGATAA